MTLDPGYWILAALESLDRFLSHGFEIVVGCLAICITAIGWKFVTVEAIWWVFKGLLVIWAVLIVAFVGGFLVWLLGRLFLEDED